MKSYDPKVVSFQRNAGYLHQKAMRNRRTGSKIDAMELLRQAVKREPENTEYLLDLSSLYAEMGLFEQSNRLLTRVMSLPNGTTECLYGMALNMLKQGDTARAESLLRAYVDSDARASHEGDARRLLDEIEIARDLQYPENRKKSRVCRLADRGAHAMHEGEYLRAVRLMDRCVRAGGSGPEIHALLALCHAMLNHSGEALSEAALSCENAQTMRPGAVKALCVCAQVYKYLKDEEKTLLCIHRAMEMESDEQERRLVTASLSELHMHAEAAEHVNRCLVDAPYDKMLLHIAAVAAYNAGGTAKNSLKHWERIHRLDPDDEIAIYYREAAARDQLPPRPLDYAYQLPKEEITFRVQLLSGYLTSGAQGMNHAWENDHKLRAILNWAISQDHKQLTRLALTILSALDSEDAAEMVRAYAIRPDAPFSLKLHALALTKLKGDAEPALPDAVFAAAGMPTEAEALEGLSVGEKQMIRYAAEYVEDAYGDLPVTPIAILWRAFQEKRGSACDPVYHTEAGSAALALCYLKLSKRETDIYTVSKWFGCGARQAAHIARRIRDIATRDDA